MEQLSAFSDVVLRNRFERFLGLTLATSLALLSPATDRFTVQTIAQVETRTTISAAPHFTRPVRHLHVLAHDAIVKAARIHAQLIDDRSGRFNANYALDAHSTNTLDWSCIRNAESHDNYRQPSGAYGILLSSWRGFGMSGTPGGASITLQDAVALRIFSMNGRRFAGSWNDYCTMNEGLG